MGLLHGPSACECRAMLFVLCTGAWLSLFTEHIHRRARDSKVRLSAVPAPLQPLLLVVRLGQYIIVLVVEQVLCERDVTHHVFGALRLVRRRHCNLKRIVTLRPHTQ